MRAFLIALILLASFYAGAHTLVMDRDFPDPSVIRVGDWYYAYATQTITEERTQQPKLLNIQVARSRDLKSWQHLGDALPVKPAWAHSTQKFWAPHVQRANGRFYMYFSADPDSHEGLCLAVAVASRPEGPFVDSGRPLKCGASFVNIDPMVFHDRHSKQNLLYWGSGFGPIRVQPLAKNMIEFAAQSAPREVLFPQKNAEPDSYVDLIEAAWVLEHDGFYYLFVSGNNCCEPSPHYAVLAARSTSPLGPFEWREHDPRKSVVIAQAGEYIGTGHNSVILGPDNKTLISLYHGINPGQMFLRYQIPGDRRVRRVLLLDTIEFKDGWPAAGVTEEP